MLMWKLFLWTLFFSFRTYPQDHCKSLPVNKSFYLSPERHGIDSFIYEHGYFDISFYQSFDDSCLVFINDRLMLNKHIQTNFSTGHTLERIFLSQPDHNDCIKITIKLVNRNICLTEYAGFNQVYRILAIYLDKNGWAFDYSNHIPFLE